jgi:hypothetical protein
MSEAAARLRAERSLEEIAEGLEMAVMAVAWRIGVLERAVLASAEAGYPLPEVAATMACAELADVKWEIIQAKEELRAAATVRTMTRALAARQPDAPEPGPLPRRRSPGRRAGDPAAALRVVR